MVFYQVSRFESLVLEKPNPMYSWCLVRVCWLSQTCCTSTLTPVICCQVKFPRERQVAENGTVPWNSTRQSTVIMLHTSPKAQFATAVICFIVRGLQLGSFLTYIVCFCLSSPELCWIPGFGLVSSLFLIY